MADDLEANANIERFNTLLDIFSDLPKAEREGELLALANAQKIVAKHMRAKKAKAATPEAKAAKAARAAAKKEEIIKNLTPVVDAACVLADREPAGTDECLNDIWDHLPKEEQDKPLKILKKALAKARQKRRALRKPV